MEKEKRAKQPAKRTKKTSGRRKKGVKLDVRYLIAAGAVLVIVVVLILGIRGCGISHKTPEGVVKGMIESYANGKEKKVKECYGAKKDTDNALQTEIDATMKYFRAHNMKSISIEDCDVLSENKKYTYVYIIYKLELENGQTYPSIGTYMTAKEDGKYYVLPASKITQDMSKQAAADYAKFMTTDTYKNYTKDYDTFIKKNPGYEEKIAGKVS